MRVGACSKDTAGEEAGEMSLILRGKKADTAEPSPLPKCGIKQSGPNPMP